MIDANVYVRHERGGLMLGGYEPDPMQVDADPSLRHRRPAARPRGAVAACAQRARAVPDLPGPDDPHRRAPGRAADAHDGRSLSRRARCPAWTAHG